MTTPTATLTDLLAATVAADPTSTAVVDMQPEPRRVSREELWRRTVTLRDNLREHGVGAGDCVGVWLPNWSDSLVWQFATAALGAHIVGINTRYGVTDVVHLMDHARPKVIAIAHDFIGLDLGAKLHIAVRDSTAPAPSVAVLTGPGRAPATLEALATYDTGVGSWVPATVSTTGEIDLDALRGAPDAVAVAFTTSGSTGMPKLAGLLDDHPAVRHVKVEDGPGRRLGRSFGVKLWPTLIFMRDGQVVSRVSRPQINEVREGLEAIAHAARPPADGLQNSRN